jgi:acyl carrier protein
MSGVLNMEDSANTPSAFWKAIRMNLKMQHQAAAIHPVPRHGNLPLSFAQERLWFIDRLRPGSPVHNLRAVFRLTGALNVAVLEKSLQEVIHRHEILRTTFPAVAGQPVQVISPEGAVKLEVIELGTLPPQQQEAEVQRLARAQVQQPFDLSQGPLMRLTLLRLAAEEHILLRTIHHIINDRWSDSVFMRELAMLYQAFCAGKPSPLPDLPIQYADVAHFQRQWLQGEGLAAQLDYWKGQLGGCPPILHLPTDHPASHSPTYEGRAQYLALPGNLTEALKTLSHRQGVSLFVVLLAAFKALLYQYSGQEDMVVCSPVAGRNRVETKKLIGYFNSLVLLRTSLKEDPSFRELMQRVSRVTLGAFEHQELPLQQVADALNLPGTILSRTLFALQNVPSQPLALAGVSVTPLDLEEGIANFDVFLSIRQREGDLRCVLRYKTDLFEAPTIARMLERYQRLLEDFVVHPDRHLSDLPHFTEARSLSDKPEDEADVAPQSEVEQRIAVIWQEALHVDKVGIHTNFFALGGRSLAMIQVCSKLQNIFNRDLSVRELFQYPTISGMARYLSQERRDQACRPTQTRTQRQQTAMKRQKQLMERQRKRH